MANKLKQVLGEGLNLPEDVQNTIMEAWNSKIDETKAEIRQEYAKKYQHDKSQLVEAMDKFLTDTISSELKEFAEDWKALNRERASLQQEKKKQAQVFEKFILGTLQKELMEFKEDKRQLTENFSKLEGFLLKQLSEEIREFRDDKRKLVEQKVKMVAEGKKHLEEARAKFIKDASERINNTLNSVLRTELSQLKEDIEIARKNEFGRKIFETFAGEYMTSYLNEGSEVKKVLAKLQEQEAVVETFKKELENKDKLVEGLNTKLHQAKDKLQRGKTLNRLLAPLSHDKRETMKGLLESVQTAQLEAAYDKYLPAVLDSSTSVRRKAHLTESRTEMNGNRANNALQETNASDTSLEDIRRLAGLQK